MGTQEVGKRIAGTVGVARSKSQLSLRVDGRLLVFLRCGKVPAEEKSMVADNFGDDVAIGVGGICVFPGEIAGVHIESSPIRGARSVANSEGGDFTSEAVLE